MFKEMRLPSYRLPLAIALCIGLGLCYVAVSVIAQTPEPAPTRASSVKDLMEYALAIAGFTSLVIGIGWGLLNQKKYDKLKETIDEQNELLDVKDKRIEELKLKYSEADARHTARIATLESEAFILEGTNEAIVSQNLQMKAILKGLRLSGAWSGHEGDIFGLHKTEG
jgi:hypothetical protein